jgi:hypothetical protein
MTNDLLTQKLKAFRALRKKRDNAVAKADELSAEYAKAETELFQLMRSQDVSSAKVGGVQFVTASTTYAQVQDKSEFIKWAQENEPELVAPAPRKGLLNQKARECLDNGEPLPPGMGVYEREYISQRTS